MAAGAVCTLGHVGDPGPCSCLGLRAEASANSEARELLAGIRRPTVRSPRNKAELSIIAPGLGALCNHVLGGTAVSRMRRVRVVITGSLAVVIAGLLSPPIGNATTRVLGAELVLVSGSGAPGIPVSLRGRIPTDHGSGSSSSDSMTRASSP